MQKNNSYKPSPLVAEILRLNGYDEKSWRDFFSWDLKQLPPFSKLKDIEKAALRITEAIEEKEGIAIYGDYDVDGTTSCALLYYFFKSLKTPVILKQPGRFHEGYGLHQEAIEKLHQQGAKLIITVDCGISNYEAAAYAQKLSVDLIITDHHKQGDLPLPPAYAVINPNRSDEAPGPMQALAGVGVAFALAWEVKKKLPYNVPSLYSLLQFVAIGSLSDLAHLNPMNLKLVRHGLKQIPSSTYPGLSVFLSEQERKLETLPSEKVGFYIGPRINSKGRMDHPQRALELLMSSSYEEAYHHYNLLEQANIERKTVQKKIFSEAKRQGEAQLKKSPDLPLIITYQKDWHEGVVGIVASKLVECFQRPTLVFTDAQEQGVIKASARGLEPLNLYETLAQHRDLYLKFGGHAMAAGLSMKKENLPTLTQRLQKLKIPPSINEHLGYPLPLSQVTPALVHELKRLEPFGEGNPYPLFLLQDFVITDYEILKDEHLRWSLKDLQEEKKYQAMSFFYFDQWKAPAPEELLNIPNLQAICEVKMNYYRGREYLQLLFRKIIK